MISPNQTDTKTEPKKPLFFSVRRKPNGKKVIVLSKKHRGEKIKKEFTLDDFAEALNRA